MIVRMHHAPFAKKVKGEKNSERKHSIRNEKYSQKLSRSTCFKGSGFTLCEGEIHALMGVKMALENQL